MGTEAAKSAPASIADNGKSSWKISELHGLHQLKPELDNYERFHIFVLNLRQFHNTWD